MGKQLSKYKSGIFRKKDYNILIIGFDESGKTSIFNRFKYFNENENTNRTIFFNLECILYKGCNFTLRDLGGEKARILWRHYFQSANAIIFVIDSTDNDNIEDAIEEFRKLLTEEDLKGCPFLIMANRQDLENAESPDEIKKKFGEIIGRKFEVIGTSAITGQGIKEGYEWVFNTIIKNNKKNS